jgi:uncharacterized delta-60 repeat protein
MNNLVSISLNGTPMKFINTSCFTKSIVAMVVSMAGACSMRICTIALCALAGAVVHAIPGQPGTLDATWGTASPIGAGKVATSIGNDSATAKAMALQLDGKVLLAGHCINGTNRDFCALRYRANGTLDTSWNGNGKVITELVGDSDIAHAMALQPDGKVLLAGYCFDGTKTLFCSLRYLANGTLDTSWGSAGTGIVTTSIGGVDSDLAFTMALQPDGKVLVAGKCFSGTNTNFCTVRYLSNGALDISWNGTGRVVTSIAIDDIVNAIAVQPNGRVLLAGYCFDGIKSSFCSLRYLADGTLDTSWGSAGTGMVTTAIGGVDGDYANGIALQPDGKVLLGGNCRSATNYNFCAARYNVDGTLDTHWNGTGKVVTPMGSTSARVYGIALLPDGGVLLAGYCEGSVVSDVCAARYHASGALDTSWNGTGKVSTSVGSGSSIANAMALQPDGKLLLAVECESGGRSDFCAIRYDGGPFGYKSCTLDLDGDSVVRATTDMLMGTRVALGMTGAAVVNGITFSANATRDSWPLIRDYLITQCGMVLP